MGTEAENRSNVSSDQEEPSEPKDVPEEESSVVLGGDVAAIAGLFGKERWVQFAFVGVGVLGFYLFDRIGEELLYKFGIDSFSVIPLAISGAILVAYFAYRQSQIRRFISEVIEELSLVNWPSREETYRSTMAVIIASIIAALYTGLFDALWSVLTDVVYST
ncbi:MAG: preprotein translocase subunit SecE [Sandaracinaceae bacterium]|nr:preprotein translocase subunit SecE [Sandaracinaceae bacterium]